MPSQSARPRLPPFAALRAFDAAARRLSFRAAAAELGVTPTAISHQIRRLEADSGVALFERRARSVALTPAGDRFAGEVGAALARVQAAYGALKDTRPGAVVTIGAGPLLTSRWLAPRLSEFAALHPDIELRLHHAQAEIWRRSHEFDIVIAWGRGDWPGVQAEKLFGLSVTPACAPALAPPGAITGPADLANLPLLHLRDTDPWRAWFAARGLPAPDMRGAVFDDANVLLQAALFGQGVMLGYVDFIRDDLGQGRLAQPLADVSAAAEAYYVIASGTGDSKGQDASAAVRRTLAWLTAQAQPTGP